MRSVIATCRTPQICACRTRIRAWSSQNCRQRMRLLAVGVLLPFAAATRDAGSKTRGAAPLSPPAALAILCVRRETPGLQDTVQGLGKLLGGKHGREASRPAAQAAALDALCVGSPHRPGIVPEKVRTSSNSWLDRRFQPPTTSEPPRNKILLFCRTRYIFI